VGGGCLSLEAGEILPESSIYLSLQGPVGPAGGPGFPGAPGAKVCALMVKLGSPRGLRSSLLHNLC
jgi:hypothetical protein